MPSLYEMYQQQGEQVRLSQEQRKTAIEEIFDKVISMYSPGGAFGKGYEAQLAGQKVQDVGSAKQSAISSGLYGLRNYGQEWGATVGAPARLKLEDIKMERLSSAMMGKAGFLEGIQEPYPDYSTLMQATAAQGATQNKTFSRTIGGTYGASSFPDQFSIGGGGSSGGGSSFDIGAYNTAAAQEREKRQTAYEGLNMAGTAPSTETGGTKAVTPSAKGHEAGMVQDYYGNWTWLPTSYSESIAYGKWKKKNQGGGAKEWRLQHGS